MGIRSDQLFRVYFVSEQAVTLEFGQGISHDIFLSVNQFNALLQQQPFPGLLATVPAYTTLTIYYDVLRVIQSDLAGGDGFEKVSVYLSRLTNDLKSMTMPKGNIFTIPVCYGGDFGPDIAEVAKVNNLRDEEVVKLHSAVTYMVYLIGFVPGFAYLGGMNDKLITPRKDTPRKAVPAGAVGIAGGQTGIYPMQTPGGWQIVGQTPLKLFDAHRSQPSLLKAGDQVVFKPIDTQEFNGLSVV